MRAWIDKVLDGVRGRRTMLIIFDSVCYIVVSLLFMLTMGGSIIVGNSVFFAVNGAIQLVLLLIFRQLLGI